MTSLTDIMTQIKAPLLHQYQNGNVNVSLYTDGTRLITCHDESMRLDYPLNIDIRLSNRCGLGYDEHLNKPSKSCAFCHESATKYGKLANLLKLQELLDTQLPENLNLELAIGLNDGILADSIVSDTFDIVAFFTWAKQRGFIVNGTVNQFSLTNRHTVQKIKALVEQQLIKGLGVSFREINTIQKVDPDILFANNTVVHVIAGIDDIHEVNRLADMGVKKILILGEKEFGFNSNDYHLPERQKMRKTWLQQLPILLNNRFEAVSFDNLALEQLKVRRFFQQADWNVFNQGEHSFYINAVDEYFAPSSRSHHTVNYGDGMTNINIQSFFKNVVENEEVNRNHRQIIPIKMDTLS